MNYSQIHKRYATALYELADEMNIIDPVTKDMETLKLLAAQCNELKTILKSPVIKPHIKNKVLVGLFENYFQQLSMKFLNLLVRKSREVFVGEIAAQYIKISREAKGIVDVDVNSVAPLSKEILAEISAQVAEFTGKRPEITEKINTSLLGGFQVSFGDSMLDLSIRKKLNIISQTFSNNIYKKGF